MYRSMRANMADVEDALERGLATLWGGDDEDWNR
jgi:hypothetical protein